GEEPHIRWGSFCEAIFQVTRGAGIERIIFVGSVASTVPHTREPRMHATMTNEAARPELEALGVSFTTYEGPSSIVTLLADKASEMGIDFTTLVVDIPHYPFVEMPTYPRSILRALDVVGRLLGLELDLSDLRAADDAVRSKLDAVMEENEEFRELVTRLEDAYDMEQSGDEELLRQLIESIDLDGDDGGDGE
ncbi:MAG: PAC2 family protein, partial [Armatimonadetes bacterium]|nr:PAC2 family protein [Armatimonadota bacterium]